ncbi:class I SAM-dependent methyltransferase [Frankia canadensis]|nr:class I SAM-dependent methyltransferase [Frankia canadensis]
MGGQGGASRTAVLVCQGRAVAQGRFAPGRFDDPTAAALLRPDERAVVEEARAGVAPASWGPRLTFEMVSACGEVMAPRTVAIDDALREALARPAPAVQLVILGAGLDGRVWRMPELAGAAVFEVDHPASQRDKRDRARHLAAAGRRPGAAPGDTSRSGTLPTYVAVDFSRDDLAAALAAAGHRRALPTAWIWEGVVPYLTRAEVTRTLQVIADQSAPGSRLIVHYHTPSLSAMLGRWSAAVVGRLAGVTSPMGREPNRSGWTARAMRRAVVARGFEVCQDDSLLTLAGALATPIRHRRSLRNGRVLVADDARSEATGGPAEDGQAGDHLGG